MLFYLGTSGMVRMSYVNITVENVAHSSVVSLSLADTLRMHTHAAKKMAGIQEGVGKLSNRHEPIFLPWQPASLIIDTTDIRYCHFLAWAMQ